MRTWFIIGAILICICLNLKSKSALKREYKAGFKEGQKVGYAEIENAYKTKFSELESLYKKKKLGAANNL